MRTARVGLFESHFRLQQQEEAARAVAAPHSSAEPEQIAPECCEAKLFQGTRELKKGSI